jgi:hypothetical protein
MRHDDAHTIQQSSFPKPSNLQKLRLKDRAKASVKKALNLDNSSGDDSPQTSIDKACEDLNESPAFNSSTFLNKARIGPTGISDKAIAFVQGAAEAIANPKVAIKQRATRNAAGKLAKSRPYLSRKADLEFLEAHDALRRAQIADDGDDAGVERRKRDVNDREDHVAEIERRRQSMMVAWVTARHVQRVRVVDAIPPPPFPEDSFFEKQDDCGYTEFQWGKWIAYVSLDSSPNLDNGLMEAETATNHASIYGAIHR